MDPITSAIVTALSAGAIGGITDTTKTAISDGYNKLKSLFTKKHGEGSEVVQAMKMLETKPESANRQGTLAEAIATVEAEQDDEIIAAAKQILILVKSQQVSQSTITIHQDHATIHGQNIGDHQHITQHFGKMPEA